MSIESLRARLDAAQTSMPWRYFDARDNEQITMADDHGDRGDFFTIAHVPNGSNVPLIGHAPVDLRLALDVIELCRDTMTALELGILGIEAGGPTNAGIYKELRGALDAFEEAE